MISQTSYNDSLWGLGLEIDSLSVMLILFTRDFPGSPVVKTAMVKTSLQDPQVQSLVWELRSHILWGGKKKKLFTTSGQFLFNQKLYVFKACMCIYVLSLSSVYNSLQSYGL